MKYRLPNEVYKRAIWTIKDYPRRKAEYEAILEASPPPLDGAPRGTVLADSTAKKAIKLSEISRELSAVEKGLEAIPEEYRKGIWENIVNRKAFPDYAHRDTYKRWKQRYVYRVAILLEYYP